MKYLIYILIFFHLPLSAVSPFSHPVVLHQISPYSTSWIYISSANSLDLIHHNSGKKITLNEPLIFMINGFDITLNRKKSIRGTWHLLPKNNIITINGHSYTGPATVDISNDQIRISVHHSNPDCSELTWGYSKSKKEIVPSYTVKVLLHELNPSNHQSQSVKISSPNGFIIFDPLAPEEKRISKKDTLELVYKNNKLWLNQKNYTFNQLRIIPKDGFALINDKEFHGSISIVSDESRTYIINHVDLEEYVYCVLKTESWPGWPIEVNKAFAIASRSYAMAMMRQSNGKLPYHIKNTNEHQTYQGMHASMTIRTAVEQTRGMFLMHNNQPALTMFDSCCGGIIPAHLDDVDFNKAPYLARTTPCKHCKKVRLYSWKKEFKLADFAEYIAHLVDNLDSKKIRDVKIGRKDKAGMVHELQIVHDKESKTIPGKQLYAALKEIKSFCYSVQRKKDTLIFSGKGYGHHLGMCQWGAREMVRDGWPYTRILDFYYPGASLVKLS